MKKVNIRQDYEILQILREYCITDIGVNELMRRRRALMGDKKQKKTEYIKRY